MTSDLDGVSAKPLCDNQSYKVLAHRSMVCIPDVSSYLLAKTYRYVSSAYWWCREPNEFVTFAIVATYSEKRSGSSEEPCGTPASVGDVIDFPDLHLTYDGQSVR